MIVERMYFYELPSLLSIILIGIVKKGSFATSKSRIFLVELCAICFNFSESPRRKFRSVRFWNVGNGHFCGKKRVLFVKILKNTTL